MQIKLYLWVEVKVMFKIKNKVYWIDKKENSGKDVQKFTKKLNLNIDEATKFCNSLKEVLKN